MFFALFTYTLIIFSIVLFLIIIVLITNFFVIIKGAPFIPTNKNKIKTILKFANANASQKIVELGSGDGRIVIALARTGAEVHGYDINPLLVFWSRYKIKKTGLDKKAFIHRQDFWEINLKNFDTIVFFAAGHIMEKLKHKIINESPKNVKVISNAFHFSDWTYTKKENQVILYQLNTNK